MAVSENQGASAGMQSGRNTIKNLKNDYQQKKPTFGFRDIWELILKLIIAIVIIVVWFTYIMKMTDKVSPVAWIVFIVLILLILWLIWRQRHFCNIKCALTGPTGCIYGFTNIISGKVLEPVTGSAYGMGFGHYVIEVRDPDGNLLSDVVIYADGGGLPDTSLVHGTFPKNTATLGWIDVEKAANDAGIILLTSTTFEITLRVFCVDGSERCTKQGSFSLEANEVFIKQAGGATSDDYPDPDEPLRTGAELATVGGSITIRGSANVYGCAMEKIAEYTIWMIKDDAFSFVQPATNIAVIPGADWYQVANIKFNGSTGFTPDQERGYNPLTGDPIPNILTNTWGTRKECHFVHIDAMWVKFCSTIPSLNPFYYNTGLLPKLNPIHEKNGTGKFTMLLQVIDTTGNMYYDIQRAWIDNEPIHAVIAGIAGLPPCKDLYTKDANGHFITVQVTGTAWDQLIDLADATKPTSDNFGSYQVYFNKQGAVSGWQLLHSSADPVPARPNPVGTGVLTDWGLATLDKVTNPDGRPADQLLDAGEGCSYDIMLYVEDKTIVSESVLHHYAYKYFPVKIINAVPK